MRVLGKTVAFIDETFTRLRGRKVAIHEPLPFSTCTEPIGDTLKITSKATGIPAKGITNADCEAVAKRTIPGAPWPKATGKYVSGKDYVEQTRFIESLNPSDMEILDKHIKSLHIDNFAAPYGSIAISSSFGETISTGGLLQCAAVSFVDKELKIQTLLHCCPTVDSKVNRAILEYILSHSKPQNLEISIAPGFYTTTDSTIDFLIKNIRSINKNYKINFMNFKGNSQNAVVLHKGKMMSCKADKITKVTNPKERIIYQERNS